MSDAVILAILMMLVTYPARALGLLAISVRGLPEWANDYLRFVAPGVLASLAAVSVLTRAGQAGSEPRIGVDTLALLASLAVVAWRRNLFLGLMVAVLLTAIGRAAGLS